MTSSLHIFLYLPNYKFKHVYRFKKKIIAPSLLLGSYKFLQKKKKKKNERECVSVQEIETPSRWA